MSGIAEGKILDDQEGKKEFDNNFAKGDFFDGEKQPHGLAVESVGMGIAGDILGNRDETEAQLRFASLENLDEAEGVDEINSYVDLNSKENVSDHEADPRFSQRLESLSPNIVFESQLRGISNSYEVNNTIKEEEQDSSASDGNQKQPQMVLSVIQGNQGQGGMNHSISMKELSSGDRCQTEQNRQSEQVQEFAVKNEQGAQSKNHQQQGDLSLSVEEQPILEKGHGLVCMVVPTNQKIGDIISLNDYSESEDVGLSSSSQAQSKFAPQGSQKDVTTPDGVFLGEQDQFLRQTEQNQEDMQTLNIHGCSLEPSKQRTAVNFQEQHNQQVSEQHIKQEGREQNSKIAPSERNEQSSDLIKIDEFPLSQKANKHQVSKSSKQKKKKKAQKQVQQTNKIEFQEDDQEDGEFQRIPLIDLLMFKQNPFKSATAENPNLQAFEAIKTTKGDDFQEERKSIVEPAILPMDTDSFGERDIWQDDPTRSPKSFGYLNNCSETLTQQQEEFVGDKILGDQNINQSISFNNEETLFSVAPRVEVGDKKVIDGGTDILARENSRQSLKNVQDEHKPNNSEKLVTRSSIPNLLGTQPNKGADSQHQSLGQLARQKSSSSTQLQGKHGFIFELQALSPSPRKSISGTDGIDKKRSSDNFSVQLEAKGNETDTLNAENSKISSQQIIKDSSEPDTNLADQFEDNSGSQKGVSIPEKSGNQVSHITEANIIRQSTDQLRVSPSSFNHSGFNLEGKDQSFSQPKNLEKLGPLNQIPIKPLLESEANPHEETKGKNLLPTSQASGLKAGFIFDLSPIVSASKLESEKGAGGKGKEDRASFDLSPKRLNFHEEAQLCQHNTTPLEPEASQNTIDIMEPISEKLSTDLADFRENNLEKKQEEIGLLEYGYQFISSWFGGSNNPQTSDSSIVPSEQQDQSESQKVGGEEKGNKIGILSENNFASNPPNLKLDEKLLTDGLQPSKVDTESIGIIGTETDLNVQELNSPEVEISDEEAGGDEAEYLQPIDIKPKIISKYAQQLFQQTDNTSVRTEDNPKIKRLNNPHMLVKPSTFAQKYHTGNEVDGKDQLLGHEKINAEIESKKVDNEDGTENGSQISSGMYSAEDEKSKKTDDLFKHPPKIRHMLSLNDQQDIQARSERNVSNSPTRKKSRSMSLIGEKSQDLDLIISPTSTKAPIVSVQDIDAQQKDLMLSEKSPKQDQSLKSEKDRSDSNFSNGETKSLKGESHNQLISPGHSSTKDSPLICQDTTETHNIIAPNICTNLEKDVKTDESIIQPGQDENKMKGKQDSDSPTIPDQTNQLSKSSSDPPTTPKSSDLQLLVIPNLDLILFPVSDENKKIEQDDSIQPPSLKTTLIRKRQYHKDDCYDVDQKDIPEDVMDNLTLEEQNELRKKLQIRRKILVSELRKINTQLMKIDVDRAKQNSLRHVTGYRDFLSEYAKERSNSLSTKIGPDRTEKRAPIQEMELNSIYNGQFLLI